MYNIETSIAWKEKPKFVTSVFDFLFAVARFTFEFCFLSMVDLIRWQIPILLTRFQNVLRCHGISLAPCQCVIMDHFLIQFGELLGVALDVINVKSNIRQGWFCFISTIRNQNIWRWRISNPRNLTHTSLLLDIAL